MKSFKVCMATTKPELQEQLDKATEEGFYHIEQFSAAAPNVGGTNSHVAPLVYLVILSKPIYKS